jgi:uncharacterized protein YdeI (YjbR/CyaY-like superfamily)
VTVKLGKLLDVADANAWRRWLEAHHASEPEIWVVYHSKASGMPSIPYNDAVDEALCFGWIDSTVKKIDAEAAKNATVAASQGAWGSSPVSKAGADSRAQRFTPRRPGSPISPMNRERVLRLRDAGRMTQAGLDAIGDLDTPFTLPPDIEAALRADDETWHNYEAFPESYRRIRVGFIEGARNRPEMFQRRLAYFLKMTKANKRYGMVQ